MKVLRLGSTGPIVSQWQMFLRGQGHLINATGTFDAATRDATIAFQKRHKLSPDGVVGNQSFGKAAMLGFELVDFTEIDREFPPAPDFQPLVSTAQRQELFGPMQFRPAPVAGNPEAIRITNGWDRENVVKVFVPQLAGIKGARADGAIWIHKAMAAPMQKLWRAWEQKGVLSMVLTFDGAYNPRFVRGRAHDQVLSNHAFGTAFDINARWNPLGAEPASPDAPGCVYRLVRIAHQCGFYWGGHFGRRDGMHFELARVA